MLTKVPKKHCREAPKLFIGQNQSRAPKNEVHAIMIIVLTLFHVATQTQLHTYFLQY